MSEDRQLRPILVGAVLVALVGLWAVWVQRLDLTIRPSDVVIEPVAP